MREDEYQKRVAELISENKVNSLQATLTENHEAVVVKVGEYDAAYTADEALSLADFLEESYDRDVSDAAEYIRKMAHIVDDLYDVNYIEEDVGEYKEIQ